LVSAATEELKIKTDQFLVNFLSGNIFTHCGDVRAAWLIR